MAATLPRYWKNLSPYRLNACLHEAVWPQTFGVLIEQVLLTCTLDRPERQLFRNWGRLVMSGISKRCHELYFIGTRSLQSERLIRVCQNAIRPYRVWGFIDTEVWKNKSTIADSLPAARTTLNPTQRFELYQKLKKNRFRVRPKDLVDASQFQISKRVAQLDLKKWQKNLDPFFIKDRKPHRKHNQG